MTLSPAVYKLLLLCICILISDFSFGQDAGDDTGKEDMPLYILISAGSTGTTFSGGHIDSQLASGLSSSSPIVKERYGFISTVQLKKEILSGYVFFKPGLSFMQKRSDVLFSNYVHDAKAYLSYLTIPVILGVQPINFKNADNLINISFEAGVAANLELGGDKSSLDPHYFDGDERYDKLVISYQIGATFDVRLNATTSLFVNYTKFQDLEPFYDRVLGNRHYDISFRVQSVSIGLMFKSK